MTEQLKRYDIVVQFGSDTMEERPNGQWVKASDIPKIKADAVLEALSDITGYYDWEWECVTATDLQKLLIEHAEKLKRGEL